MSVIIPRNTIIPTRKVQERVTCRDNQTTAVIKVFEGERARSTDNKLLGELKVAGLQLAPRWDTVIDVCFDLQANGILKVSAKDRKCGKEESISVTNGQLSRDEIQRMIEEANMYEEEDERHRKKHSAMLAFKRRALEMRDETKEKKEKIMKAEEAIVKAFKWSDSKKDLTEVSEYEEKTDELESLLESV